MGFLTRGEAEKAFSEGFQKHWGLRRKVPEKLNADKVLLHAGRRIYE